MAMQRGRRSLQRRLFLWFGITIVMTVLVVGGVFALFGPGSTRWQANVKGAESLVSQEFARVWGDAAERRGLAERAANAFDVNITLEDQRGAILTQVGEACRHTPYSVTVKDGNRMLGTVRVCGKPPHGPGVLFGALAAAGLTLWIASAAISHRLTRPLGELVHVTREIGAGKLSSRVRLGRHQPGEVGVLAEAVNDMAARIEKQMRDQRELLAAVSHEIRSPLSRLRVLAELAQEEQTRDKAISDLEREIVEIDELVGKLLASSRLDFEALNTKPVAAGEAARRALETANLDPALLEDRAPAVQVDADATLLGRALGNLLDNARTHGGGARKLVIRSEGPSSLVFEVIDGGPGFEAADLPRVFEPFFRSGQRGHGSLGLGLSLVDRIARAHGGRAFAHNRPEGGASVGIKLPITE